MKYLAKWGIFYRTTHMYRTYIAKYYVSVCLSVTSRCFIQTATWIKLVFGSEDAFWYSILGLIKFLWILSKARSFVRSLLRAEVQPTLDSSAETFMSVQCASPGRGRELVGVCGVCDSCVGWRKGWVGVSSLSGISKRAPSRRGLLSG